jgi:hypothetical protein
MMGGKKAAGMGGKGGSAKGGQPGFGKKSPGFSSKVGKSPKAFGKQMSPAGK